MYPWPHIGPRPMNVTQLFLLTWAVETTTFASAVNRTIVRSHSSYPGR